MGMIQNSADEASRYSGYIREAANALFSSDICPDDESNIAAVEIGLNAYYSSVEQLANYRSLMEEDSCHIEDTSQTYLNADVTLSEGMRNYWSSFMTRSMLLNGLGE